MKPTEHLRQWLETEPGPWRIGQVCIEPGYRIHHVLDVDLTALMPVLSLAALRQILKQDAGGNFRPVRGAPNLRSGWLMPSLSLARLNEALNVIYPAAIAQWARWKDGNLPAVEFQETAGRQTGMYRITGTLGSERLMELTSQACASGCLRRRLWAPRCEVRPGPSEIPLLCPEACNFFIGKAREMIKGKPAEE